MNDSTDEGQQFWTVEHLAETIDMSTSWVRAAIRAGEIPAVRVGPKRLLIPRSYLESLVEAANGEAAA